MELPISQNDFYWLGNSFDFSNDHDAPEDKQSQFRADQGYGSNLKQDSENESHIGNKTYNCKYCQNEVEVIKGKQWDADEGYISNQDTDLVVSSWAGGYNDNWESSPFGRDGVKPRNVFWPTWWNIKHQNRCANQCVDSCYNSCASGCYGQCVMICTLGCYSSCTTSCTQSCTTSCTEACTTGCTSHCTTGCYMSCTACAGPSS